MNFKQVNETCTPNDMIIDPIPLRILVPQLISALMSNPNAALAIVNHTPSQPNEAPIAIAIVTVSEKEPHEPSSPLKEPTHSTPEKTQ